MKQVFRTTWQQWLGKAYAPAALVLIVVLVLLLVDAVWLAVVLVVTGVVCGAMNGTRELGKYLEMDDEGFRLRIGKTHSEVAWKDVTVAWVTEAEEHKPLLHLGFGDDGLLQLPLWLLGGQPALKAMRQHLGEARFAEEAQRRWPGNETVTRALEDVLPDAAEPICVRTPPAAFVLMAIGFLFTAGLSAMFLWILFLPGEPTWGLRLFALVLALIPLSFTVLIVVSVLTYGPLKMDREGVSLSSLVGQWRMPWAEIEEIHWDPNGSAVAFVGSGKRLVANGPAVWARKDKDKALHVLGLWCLKHRTAIKRTPAAILWSSRGTRVPKGNQT